MKLEIISGGFMKSHRFLVFLHVVCFSFHFQLTFSQLN